MKNQIFDFSRFAKYFRKYFYENRKNILVNIAVVFLVPMAYCILYPYLSKCYSFPLHYTSDPMWTGEQSTFTAMFIFLILAGAAVTGHLLRSKQQRTMLLSSPASNLEKFLTPVLVYIVGIAAVFCLGAWIGDAMRVWTHRAAAVGNNTPCEYMPIRYILDFGMNPHDARFQDGMQLTMFRTLFAVAVFAGSSIFALGAMLWPKATFIKTGGALIVWNLALTYIVFWSVSIFHGNGDVARFQFLEDFDTVFAIFNCAWIALTCLFWGVAYARFKEWEIINRW